MTYCTGSFVGRQSQSLNCYEIIIKTRVHIKEAAQEHSRVFEDTFREHLENISMITFLR